MSGGSTSTATQLRVSTVSMMTSTRRVEVLVLSDQARDPEKEKDSQEPPHQEEGSQAEVEDSPNLPHQEGEHQEGEHQEGENQEGEHQEVTADPRP